MKVVKVDDQTIVELMKSKKLKDIEKYIGRRR